MESKYNYKSSYFSTRNSILPEKPNEDFLITDDINGIYIIADGVTSTPKEGKQYPQPSGGEMAAKEFCNSIYRYLSSKNDTEDDPIKTLNNAVCFGNEQILKLNEAYNRINDVDFEENDYFGTVGTALTANQDKFYVAHVGDIMVIHLTNHSCSMITDIQTKEFHNYYKKVMRNGIVSSVDLLRWIRKSYRNNKKSELVDGFRVDYGVFTGEEGAIDYIENYIIDIKSGDSIFILTDGLQPFVTTILENPEQQKMFIEETVQNRDPLNWIRNKNNEISTVNDDQTAILIKIN